MTLRARTVAAASTIDKASKVKTGADSKAAADVGKRVAEAAKKAGVTEVIFDRGGFLYHGRVKALADAAREGGLEFLSMADEDKKNRNAGRCCQAGNDWRRQSAGSRYCT